MKVLQVFLGVSVLSLAVVSHANEATSPTDTMTVKAETVEAVIGTPVVEAVQKNENTILISPRTGMRYTVNNPANLPIVFKTEIIGVANSANANRIVAANPALSAESQQKAQAALVEMVSPNPTAVPATQ